MTNNDFAIATLPLLFGAGGAQKPGFQGSTVVMDSKGVVTGDKGTSSIVAQLVKGTMGIIDGPSIVVRELDHGLSRGRHIGVSMRAKAQGMKAIQIQGFDD